MVWSVVVAVAVASEIVLSPLELFPTDCNSDPTVIKMKAQLSGSVMLFLFALEFTPISC